MPPVIRRAEPADYAQVIANIDAWWGGRPMAPMLPKLFFVHFGRTTFVAAEGDRLVGFLCGFRSQTFEEEAYIHFVGVDPQRRGGGLARALYERFFEEVSDRSVVRAVTSPQNTGSIAFHQALGFEIERVDDDYDGAGASRVLFVKYLQG